MKAYGTKIDDVKIIEPTVYDDERGFFFESFNLNIFEKIINTKVTFVQDNQSFSKRNVLRGLHYQKPPFEQAKLIRVVKGEIFDVAVDIRKNSKTYCNWVGETLSEQNKKMLWIPRGFLHGFQVISEEAVVLYKTDNYYSRNSEVTIKWNDKDIGIDWKKKLDPILSSKDKKNSLNISELNIFS